MRDLFYPGRSVVHATNGMAATSHPLSTATAVNILNDGGNAIDAAIAAVAVQCVVEPHSTGIGGDCFCLLARSSGEVIGYNGSGTTPSSAHLEWYNENDLTFIEQNSPHSVTIPGAVDAWHTLLQDHGSMPLSEVLKPAIGYAENGFSVHHRQQIDWAMCLELLKNDPTSASQFLINNKIPSVGDIIKLPLLAHTLKEIANNGRDAFYKGWMMEDMVSHLKKLGGLHSEEDFANYTGKYIEPIKSNYRDYSVIECPPNGQGIIALAGLNILSNFNMADLPPDSAERLHLEIEATRIAYRDRGQFLGDPDFNELPIDNWLNTNTGKLYAEQIDTKKRSSLIPGQLIANHEDTVYLTVVDKDRNAVSLINSLFKSFGSGLTAPKSGIILHSRGEGFTLKPDHPNTIGPNKRPLHTIIPGLLAKNDQIVMSFGVMGGQYQACGHMHLLSNLLDYGMDLQEAIDFPRIFPDFENGDQRVQIEPGFNKQTLTGLKDMGHELYTPEAPIGGAQAIWIDWENNVLRGASDPRKDGMASGY